jgi:Ca-activated chloride channel family protein
MKFEWPELLALLGLVPLLVAAYVWLLRRRKKAVLRFASLSLVRVAMGPSRNWRRHVPPVLFLLAVTALLLAAARPTAIVSVPSQHESVILAIDVSGSMRARDVEPDRITAAQAAARAFIAERPANTRVGVVSFAATAQLAQQPTRTREEALAAIDRFQLQRGTAIGSGILVALKAIFPDVQFDLRAGNPRRDPKADARDGKAGRRGAAGEGEQAARAAEAGKADKGDKGAEGSKGAAKAVAPGSYASAAIILLTDGQSNVGPDPVEAARMAAERGVRIYTVGFGTTKGETLSTEGWSGRVRLDEETLKTIANVTRGEYMHAGSASELAQVYKKLGSKLVFERREMEVGGLFAAAAAVLVMLAAGLSMLWFRRLA